MNLSRYLLENGRDNDPAIVCLDRTYTYAELKSAAACVAGYLARSGGNTGDRVLLIAESSFFWAATYLGVLQAGLVCVPLPTKASPADTKWIVASAEAKFVFIEQRSLTKFLAHVSEISIVCDRPTRLPSVGELVDFEALTKTTVTPDPGWAELNPDDLAAIMFTSGSTGIPRGVLVSVKNIVANTNSIISYLALTSADRMMAVLPFHYCFGASLLHTHLRTGASIVIDPRFLYPDKVLERMIETGCTGFAGVPSHYQILLRRSTLSRMNFPQLRYVQQAGGHLAPTFVDELRQALPGKDIFIMYGQTEATARLAYLPPEFLDSKRGSIGKAIPGVCLSVLDDSGNPVDCGGVGEVVAEGDNITQGYWRDPKETARSFRNGKLYTGDVATVDRDGFIYLVDRAKDFLKCGGQRVSCRSIEDTLLECGVLLEAAVIGIPDQVLGEAVKAFVVPRGGGPDGLDETIRNYCRSRLPLALVPKEIVWMDALPRNSSGKVLKQVLRGEAPNAN